MKVTILYAESHCGVCAAVARTMQLPGAVYVRTPDEEFTEHPVEPALSTEYEIAPLPEVDANTDGVNGDCGIVTAVNGDHA
ncbi:MAG: hypothetical protein ACO3VI_10715, partial [Ilumatobacteraceae bacterium]